MRLLDNPVHFVSGNERVYWPTYRCSVAQIFVQGIDTCSVPPRGRTIFSLYKTLQSQLSYQWNVSLIHTEIFIGFHWKRRKFSFLSCQFYSQCKLILYINFNVKESSKKPNLTLVAQIRKIHAIGFIWKEPFEII